MFLLEVSSYNYYSKYVWYNLPRIFYLFYISFILCIRSIRLAVWYRLFMFMFMILNVLYTPFVCFSLLVFYVTFCDECTSAFYVLRYERF